MLQMYYFQARPVLGASVSLHGPEPLQTVPIYVLDFLNFAQRRRCAAAIFALEAALIFLRLRPGLLVPP